MIDVIDRVMDMTRKAERFGGRVFRTFPRQLDRMEPFAVVDKGAHTPIFMEDGHEVITDLTYLVTILDYSPEDMDGVVRELTTIYNRAHIQIAGNTRGYRLSNDAYTVQLTLSMRVDKRGQIYPR